MIRSWPMVNMDH